jgi:hypothetical protein
MSGIRDDLFATFNHAKDGSLADSASPLMLAFAGLLVLFKSTEIAFIYYDFAREIRPIIFIEHRAKCD